MCGILNKRKVEIVQGSSHKDISSWTDADSPSKNIVSGAWGETLNWQDKDDILLKMIFTNTIPHH